MFVEVETSSDSSENSDFIKDNTDPLHNANLDDKKTQQMLDDEDDLNLHRNVFFPKEDMKSRIASAQERMKYFNLYFYHCLVSS